MRAITSALALVIFFCGCTHRHQTQKKGYDGSPWATGQTLEKHLNSLGITKQNCSLMTAKGNEHTSTAGVQVTFNPDEISFIWDAMFRTAEPYTYWEASGNIQVELRYSHNTKTNILLYVNATDRTTIDGERGAYICRGLNKLLIQKLNKEKSNQQVDPIVTTPVDEVEAQGTQGHP